MCFVVLVLLGLRATKPVSFFGNTIVHKEKIAALDIVWKKKRRAFSFRCSRTLQSLALTIMFFRWDAQGQVFSAKTTVFASCDFHKDLQIK